MKKLLLTLTTFLLAVSFTACAASGDMSGGEINGSPLVGADGAAGGAAARDGADDSGTFGGALTTFAPTGISPEGDIAHDMAAKEDWISGDVIPEENIFDSENSIPPAAGTLTAGEWIDNDHYSFWKDLFQKADTGWEEYRSLWDRAFCSRIFVTAESGGKPLENSLMTLINGEGEILWRARTDNEGKAYLFYSPSELSKGDLTVTSDFGGEIKVNSDDDAVSFIKEQEESRSSKTLDLALVVDTTGSMADELSYLQKELESVIERAARDNGNIPVRLSVNFYRDDGDEYVVRDFDFTDDISYAVEILKQQEADGGGDNPEKVNAVLDSAINNLSWNEDSVKLLFIILDAPPHSDDSTAVTQMNELTAQAAEKGIRLIPILASGGDKETEFLMRDFALKTGGSYLFLTDDSGVSAGGHITPTTGAYTVEKLNDLMVKVINRYLANAPKTAEYIDINVEFPQGNVTSTDADVTTAPPTTDISPAVDGEITLTLTPEQSGDLRVFRFDLYNKTDKLCYYGDKFNLEKCVDSEWISMEPVQELPELMIKLEPGENVAYIADTFHNWGVLEDGDYRIALSIVSEDETKTVYGYFSIPEIFPEDTVTMTLSGTSADDPLEFFIYNGTDREYSFGRYFSVEKYEGDKWTVMEPDEPVSFTDDLVILPARESCLFHAPVHSFWKNLTEGSYRVALEVFGGEKAKTIYGRFEVGNTEGDGDISMILKSDPETLGENDPLEYIIRNRTDRVYYYGLGFSLEKLVNEEWESIPPTEDFAVNSIAMISEPGKDNFFEAPVRTFWKELEDGVYRVVMNVSCEVNSMELYGQFRVADGKIKTGNFDGSPAMYND